MVQRSAQGRKNAGHLTLHIGASFEAAWENVLQRWFESSAPTSVRNEASVAVVTPFRSHAYFLRRKLLARGISLLGIKFLSPAQLREALLRGSGQNIPLREHLRLLLAIAAEQFAADKIDPPKDGFALANNERPEHLVAKSVARDPDHFLRAIDELRAAGWDFDEISDPALREIAARFENLARECQFTFVQEADCLAAANAGKSPPRFSNLLISGFDGAHWPLWPLLRTAVIASSQAVVVLNDPRDEARDLDETWVGTWEETFGSAEPVGDPQGDAQEKDQLHNVNFLVG